MFFRASRLRSLLAMTDARVSYSPWLPTSQQPRCLNLCQAHAAGVAPAQRPWVPCPYALSVLGLSSRGAATCNCIALKAYTLYWGHLPAISPASAGKQVFAEALAAGTMNNFFKLIEQFRTQVGRRLHKTVWPGLGAAV